MIRFIDVIAIILMVLACLVIVHQSVLACTCDPSPIDTEEQLRAVVETALQGAVAVFSGRVVEVSGKCNEGTRIIVFHSWKAEFPNNAALVEGIECISEHIAIGDSCKKGFYIGKEYLIFADPGRGGRLYVSQCSRTDFYNKSERIIKMLDQLIAEKQLCQDNRSESVAKEPLLTIHDARKAGDQQ